MKPGANAKGRTAVAGFMKSRRALPGVVFNVTVIELSILQLSVGSHIKLKFLLITKVIFFVLV